MPTHPPTRLIAGITVPNTPLITSAIAYARTHGNELTYNHIMRSWLLGAYISSQIPPLSSHDTELHALAAILHDLGWDLTGKSELVSKDKRFEVDSANAARDFVAENGEKGEWDGRRLQLLWDAVVLHATHSIALHKEVECRVTVMGIVADFTGPEKSPGGVLSREVWEGVVKEFPRDGFRDGVKEIMCHLCSTKPETTYDNFVGDFGAEYVEGYSKLGKRDIDFLMGGDD